MKSRDGWISHSRDAFPTHWKRWLARNLLSHWAQRSRGLRDLPGCTPGASTCRCPAATTGAAIQRSRHPNCSQSWRCLSHCSTAPDLLHGMFSIICAPLSPAMSTVSREAGAPALGAVVEVRFSRHCSRFDSEGEIATNTTANCKKILRRKIRF